MRATNPFRALGLAATLGLFGCVSVQPAPVYERPIYGAYYEHAGFEHVYDVQLGLYTVIGVPNVYFVDGWYWRQARGGWERCASPRGAHWVRIERYGVPPRLWAHGGGGRFDHGAWSDTRLDRRDARHEQKLERRDERRDRRDQRAEDRLDRRDARNEARRDRQDDRRTQQQARRDEHRQVHRERADTRQLQQDERRQARQTRQDARRQASDERDLARRDRRDERREDARQRRDDRQQARADERAGPVD